MTTSPRLFISVIIPTYCRPAALRRCIASLRAQEYPSESFEVIVADDGGDPPADRSLAEEPLGGPRLLVVRQSRQGAGMARTTGMASARGQILAFLDDDCSVPPNYLARIAHVFHAYSETQVVQVGLDQGEPENIYGRAWKFALDETLKVNLLPSPNGRLTSGILGGVMVARRDVFTRVAFEAALSRGREDADLRYQLEARNIPVYYDPSIHVLHHYRHTLRGYLTTVFAYGRGEFHLRRKWTTGRSPFRYVSLTSWRALRSLLGTDGVRRGLAVYCILLLKRHAGLCGLLYETAVWRSPQRTALCWTRFGWLLATAYVCRPFLLCKAVVLHGLAALRSFKRRRLPVGSDS